MSSIDRRQLLVGAGAVTREAGEVLDEFGIGHWCNPVVYGHIPQPKLLWEREDA